MAREEWLGGFMGDPDDPRGDLDPDGEGDALALAKQNRLFIRVLAVIVALTVLAIGVALYVNFKSQSDITEGRAIASLDNCRGNQAQDDVLRSMLKPSIEADDPISQEEIDRLRHTYERVLGRTPGDKPLKQVRLELVEHLMEPLGGYQTTPKEQKQQCLERLRRARLPVPRD